MLLWPPGEIFQMSLFFPVRSSLLRRLEHPFTTPNMPKCILTLDVPAILHPVPALALRLLRHPAPCRVRISEALFERHLASKGGGNLDVRALGCFWTPREAYILGEDVATTKSRKKTLTGCIRLLVFHRRRLDDCVSPRRWPQASFDFRRPIGSSWCAAPS